MSLKTHQLKIEYCVQSEIIYIGKENNRSLSKIKRTVFFCCRLQHKIASADINCQLESFAFSVLF